MGGGRAVVADKAATSTWSVIPTSSLLVSPPRVRGPSHAREEMRFQVNFMGGHPEGLFDLEGSALEGRQGHQRKEVHGQTPRPLFKYQIWTTLT